MIGEEGSTVAVEAIGSESSKAWFGFGEEEFETSLLFGGQFGFAFQRSVKLGVKAESGEKEVFDGQTDVLWGDLTRSESGAKERRIDRVGLELRCDVFEGLIHLKVVFDRNQGLGAERIGAAVPEEGIFPSEVEERHGVAVAMLAVDAGAEAARVAEGFSLMAGSAGNFMGA